MKANKETLKRLRYVIPYWLVSLLIVFGAYLGGVRLREAAALAGRGTVWAAAPLAVLCAVPVLLALLQHLNARRYRDRLGAMDAEERIRFLLSHREDAEKTAAEKYRLIGRLRRGSDLTACLLALLGALISFFAGLCFKTAEVFTPVALYCLALLFAALPRLDPLNRRPFAAQGDVLDEKEYPELYKSLRAAAEKTGFTGEILVSVSPDCNAGVVKTGRGCIVELGALLWYVLTPEELGAIFLHEFAHLRNPYIKEGGADVHAVMLWRMESRPFFPFLQDLFYMYFDLTIDAERELFLFSVSLLSEEAADGLMRRAGDAKTAAAALIKTGYYLYYEWMNGTVEYENPFVSEETFRSMLRRNAECFLHTAEEHGERWNRLIESELPFRSETHPLLKDRLKDLGFDRLFLPDLTRVPCAFTAECDRAITFCGDLLFERLPQPFNETRDRMFIEPLAAAEAWEAQGRPLDTETYAEIDDALRNLNRMEEANELCRRAIETLPEPAALHAYFSLGMYMLHDFDPEGIPLVYRAADGNSNYYEDGYDAIGSFCCIMGLSEALEAYRARYTAALQKDIDFYSKMEGLSKKDDLRPEQLPEALLKDLTAFFTRAGGDRIQSVSVIRKTVSPAYYLSPVIVRFFPGVSEETKDQLMRQIFTHLDTCSDWQFSLYEYEEAAHVGKDLLEEAVIWKNADA